MSRSATKFWTEKERYHDLAKSFEENINITHPAYLSGRSGCGFCHNCTWAASKVKYYKHNGPVP